MATVDAYGTSLPPHRAVPIHSRPCVDSGASPLNEAILLTLLTLAPPPTHSESKRSAIRIAPGLEARVHRLQEKRWDRAAAGRRTDSIGRIPDERLEALERLNQRRQQREGGKVDVQRRRHTWTAPPLPIRVMPPSGGVRLDGGPVMSEAEGEQSMLESDVSSIITISDRLVPSDTEEESADHLQDKQKYRMPDGGKTRLHLRTKEPLSPTSRHVPRSPRRQQTVSGPSTPRLPSTPTIAGQRNCNNGNPRQTASSITNASQESVSDGDITVTSRTGSIYTLGRVSLQGQLAHLTTLRLPDADSLAKRISSIPTSTEAAKALSDASAQIRIWISKASEVLSGLNAEDDVEWAAAGGREGIEDVDGAINRFERLVEVYIASIERLQLRADVHMLRAEELMGAVKQMESIISSWQKIKETLKGVKEQVEIAMEWEELWNSVLGEIAQELHGLERLVFEMEERRHAGAAGLISGKDSIDLAELETIVEERPGGNTVRNRFSLPPFSPSSPVQPPTNQEGVSPDDSSLLALFARMQPLRASLDFLPMRLSVFHIRGNPVFPSACVDLEHRRDQLEEHWKKLEADAESLRRELGEDRWILVFRNAGRQALKMCESVTRSYHKLKEAMESQEQHTDFLSFAKKIENYEAKKLHYGPAIERVLAIIDRGVLDRLTVNGEILRLQSDMKRRWNLLQTVMRELDAALEPVTTEAREKQLRDSVSTIMSSETSITSSRLESSGSSPASSIAGTSRRSSFQRSRTPTPLLHSKTRQSVSRGRSSSHILSSIPRRVPLTQSGDSQSTSSPSSLSAHVTLEIGIKEDVCRGPRWNGTRRLETRDFLPLSAFEPSPYAKTPVERKTNFLRASSTPIRNVAVSTKGSASPRVVTTPTAASAAILFQQKQPQQQISRKSSLPVPSSGNIATPPDSNFRKSVADLHLSSTRRESASGRRSSGRASRTDSFTVDGNEADSESPLHHKGRLQSVIAPPTLTRKRSSLLPTPSATASTVPISGHSRPSPNLSSIVGQEKGKPKWR